MRFQGAIERKALGTRSTSVCERPSAGNKKKPRVADSRQHGGDLPDDYVWTNGVGDTSVLLDFSSTPMGGVLGNHLDTLHSDYAFIISTGPIVKGRRIDDLANPPQAPDWDFIAYPNPANEEFNLRFADNSPKYAELIDCTGKRLQYWNNIGGPDVRLSLGKPARGLYLLRVITEDGCKSKTLIIH